MTIKVYLRKKTCFQKQCFYCPAPPNAGDLGDPRGGELAQGLSRVKSCCHRQADRTLPTVSGRELAQDLERGFATSHPLSLLEAAAGLKQGQHCEAGQRGARGAAGHARPVRAAAQLHGQASAPCAPPTTAPDLPHPTGPRAPSLGATLSTPLTSCRADWPHQGPSSCSRRKPSCSPSLPIPISPGS